MYPEAVITGLGFVTSLGHSRAGVSESLRSLRHGLSLWPMAAELEVPVAVVGQVAGFEVSSTRSSDWSWPADCPIDPEEVRAMPPQGVYALAAVRQALAEAGLQEADLGDGRSGLFTASVGSARMLHHHLSRMEASAWRRIAPTSILSSIAGSLNFHLASLLGVRGASCGFVSACASGGHALGFALDEIRLGRQDRMMVVAAEEVSMESVLPFAGMGALSLQTDPRLASRPFDRHRDGFVATGGAVALVLESLDSAEARQVRPLARMTGWAQTCDGHHPAAPHPDGQGIREAMLLAMKDAGVEPSEVEYVNAHATSTPAGDRAEARALRAVFGTGSPLAISSTKALTGHALSLAGVMEAAFCTLAMDEGFLPGQAHLSEPDEACAGLNLPRRTLLQRPRVVLNNGCGFGGSNVVHVLQSLEP